MWTEGGDPSLATVEGFNADPSAAWKLFGPMRHAARAAAPNAAHRALADAARRCSGDFTVITQNVDGLHQRAGSASVIEIHGSLFRSRCADATCTLVTFEDFEYAGDVPRCPICAGPIRPDVVFFNEPMPVAEEWAVKKALRDVDLFVAVGTSGTVSPASSFVRSAAYNNARTIYVNLEPMTRSNPYFREVHLGRAEELLPELFTLES